MTYVRYTCLGAVQQRVLGDPIDRTPVPPVVEYDARLGLQSKMMRKYWSGTQLRRIVVMLRRGETFVDIGRALGKQARSLPDIYNRPPEDLQ